VLKIIPIFLVLLCFVSVGLTQDSKEKVTYEDDFSNIVNEFNALKQDLVDAREDYRKLK
jgi:hypothetical protein